MNITFTHKLSIEIDNTLRLTTVGVVGGISRYNWINIPDSLIAHLRADMLLQERIITNMFKIRSKGKNEPE